jgi:hypothetical protein
MAAITSRLGAPRSYSRALRTKITQSYSIPTVVCLSVLVLLETGCRGEFLYCEQHPEVCVGDTGAESETGVVGDGREWCTVTPGAKWTTPNPDEDIEDSENDYGDPEACFCANEDIDSNLTAIDASQMGIGAAVLASHSAQYGNDIIDFRDMLWDAAEDRCSLLSNAHEAWADNCLTAIDKNESGGNPAVTPLVPEGSFGDCSVGMAYGDWGYAMPADNWDDYYTLNNVISQNPTNGVYEIDQAFFEDMLDNPAWLLNDAAYIDWNGSAFQLYSVTSGTIAAALGLQSGDRPQTLNDLDVTSLDDVLAAHQRLHSETSFELVVLRGGGSATLHYSVIP